MEPLPELLALLGKPCSWISIRDGEKKKDFVMAVRLDGKVQTSESLFQIPGDVIGGHINKPSNQAFTGEQPTFHTINAGCLGTKSADDAAACIRGLNT